jgi:hypothetical protein
VDLPGRELAQNGSARRAADPVIPDLGWMSISIMPVDAMSMSSDGFILVVLPHVG